jgi:hypothetical protein
MPEVRMKLDKMLRVWLFKKCILLDEFLRNLAIKHCDPYIVTPVGIMAKLVLQQFDLEYCKVV